jgi:hypothetical protein
MEVKEKNYKICLFFKDFMSRVIKLVFHVCERKSLKEVVVENLDKIFEKTFKCIMNWILNERPFMNGVENLQCARNDIKQLNMIDSIVQGKFRCNFSFLSSETKFF